MSASETIKPVDLETSPLVLQKPEDNKKTEDKKRQEGSGIDPLFLAYMFIFQAVQICHDTAGIQAKSVQSLGLAQNNEINQEAQLNFYQLHKSQLNNKHVITAHWSIQATLGGGVIKTYVAGKVWFTPATVASTVLENLNIKNQEISALRNQFGDKLTVMQQNSSMDETNVNSIMNEDQQDISQGAAILQMMVSLSNQISQI